MIVVDTSALLAIFFDEPEKAVMQHCLAIEDECLISAVNAHEAMIVVRLRHGRSALRALDEIFASVRLEIAPFDQAQVVAAVAAFERFGKGLHSTARLNICDCAAYALAKTMNAPLLFKGDDFSHTDIMAAV